MPRFAPDIHMIIGPAQAGFQLAIGSKPETVTEGTELGVMQGPYDLDL
jgi:hypothetical protein